jgi:fumarate reductase flavoprotein subunit
MEAIQFHPTAIVPAGILVTEGCRGDGGLLLDGAGHRFMPDYEPDKMELASRDVVSRRMEQHIAAGHGVRSRFGEHLWLDIRLLGRAHIERNLREVKEICHYFLGIDPVQDLIPVRPAQHYSMGGVRTDHRGHSPQLRGLFAAGESACWDIHGFNRLGGNSVAETVVAGMIVGDSMADFVESPEGALQVSTALIEEFGHRERQRIAAIATGTAGESAFELTRLMQDTMTENVGIFRHGDRLQEAVDTLQKLQRRAANITLRSSAPGPNPELIAAYRLQRMLKLAQCTAYGALQRTESRGAHYRADYPRRNDGEWMRRTLATWPDPEADLPKLDYEALDIMGMELPPGWRGYGDKDYIAHPDTKRRQREIDAALAGLGDDADRYRRQQTLMPFKHLLPTHLRRRNQRLGEES